MNLTKNRISSFFPDTLWTAIERAKDTDSEESVEVLNLLCSAYRPALLKVLVSWGHPLSDAEDLLHDFMQKKFLHKHFIASVDKSKGRFRCFLEVSFLNFLRTHHSRSKRVSHVVPLAILDLEAMPLASQTDVPASEIIDKAWAEQVISISKNRLMEEGVKANKGDLVSAFLEHLESSGERAADIAERSGTTPGSIHISFHRLRERLRWLIRDEVRRGVGNPHMWAEEMEVLISALRK